MFPDAALECGTQLRFFPELGKHSRDLRNHPRAASVDQAQRVVHPAFPERFRQSLQNSFFLGGGQIRQDRHQPRLFRSDHFGHGQTDVRCS